MISIEASADAADTARIGQDTKVWHLAQIRENANIGRNCSIGRGAYVGPGVRIGDNTKIQNYALIYEPAWLGTGVFVGPSVVLTNDTYPRAVNPDGSVKNATDWNPVGVTIEEGASIGAGAVCIAPVRIGRWATVAAGAVVTRDVPAFTLVAGIPARRVGWIGKAGKVLVKEGDAWLCPETRDRFLEHEGALLPELEFSLVDSGTP